MEQVKISEIKIGKRIRKNYGDINSLADSLQRHGQIQPILLNKNLELVAGGRRLEAAKQLQWETIGATFREELDDVSKRELELEENIRRKEFDWPEEVLGVEHLFKLRQKRYGEARDGRPSAYAEERKGFSLRDAAEEFDMSLGSVSMDLELARGIREFPELCDEKTKTSAFKRLKVLREKAIRREQASRTRSDVEDEGEGQEADEVSPEAERAPTGIRKAGFKGYGLIYFGDSRIVLRSMPEASVDLIVTDPPYALGMHAEGETTGERRLTDSAGAMYDDDPHKVLDCIDTVVRECARILKPEGHAYFFFHMRRYEDIFPILERHFGEAVDPVPIVWIKNTSGIGDPNKSWVYGYEPCFFINRGRSLVKPQAFNYIESPTVPPKQKIHPTEKPTALLRHIIEASAVPGEIILDPFAGSGSALVAAVELGCKFVGCEAMEEFYTKTVDRLAETIGQLQLLEKKGGADGTGGAVEQPNGEA